MLEPVLFETGVKIPNERREGEFSVHPLFYSAGVSIIPQSYIIM